MPFPDGPSPARSAPWTLREPPPGGPPPEALVHDLWRFQHFDRRGLTTTTGAPVEILAPGRLNTDGGPDFHLAHLVIDGRTWHGDIEIHVRSGQWFEHGHHDDPRYDSTILHVCLEPDVWTGALTRTDGSLLPELVLADRLQAPVRRLLYRFLTGRDAALPCAGRWDVLPETDQAAWIDVMARERLSERRAALARDYLGRPDLEALLHRRLFRGLGYAPNADALEELAHRLPLALVRTVAHPRDVEALHLGTAGLLPSVAELAEGDRATAAYVLDLRRRHDRLQAALDVASMPRTAWHFFRLRPANFPTLRIAQAAALVSGDALLGADPLGRLLGALRADRPGDALRRLLRPRPGPFWDDHVRLRKASAPRDPRVGRSRADTLIADAAAPVLILYAEQHDTPDIPRAVTALLRALPARPDRVVRAVRALGYAPRDAYEVQGAHQLYRTRCTQAGCLRCPVGRALLD